MDKKHSRIFLTSFKEIKPEFNQYVSYMKGQRETCPTTGKLHWHAYIELKKSTRFSVLKKLWEGDNIQDIKDEKGALRYVEKPESRIEGTQFEEGDKKSQGQRNDLKKIVEDIKNNDVQMEDVLKYSRGIKEVRAILNKESRTKEFRILNVEVLIGKSGAGKTRSVYDKYGYENVYKLDCCQNETWFDGYEGEKVLLIDDFYGWIKWGHLLNILDGYPLRLQIKGGHDWANWDKVYITSNKNIEDWYARVDISALHRRINNISYFGLEVGSEVAGNTNPQHLSLHWNPLDSNLGDS